MTSQANGAPRGGAGAAFFAGRFGIDEQLCERLLGVALGRGGDYAELYFEHRENGNIVFEDQKVKSAGGGVMSGVGVRVIRGDSIGYAYTEDLSFEAIKAACEAAAHISTAGEQNLPVGIDAAPTPSYYPVLNPAAEVGAAEKLAVIRRADEAARRYHPSIVRVDVSLVDELKRVLIASSDGKFISDVQPMVRFNVGCLSEIDGSRQTARSGGGGRYGMEYFAQVTPEALAIEAAREAVLLQEAVPAPAGVMPVVLGAGDSGILLHEAVGHGLEADFNRKQTSTYSGRVGQLVASELVTVVDDGTIVNSRGSINIDDEGNPGRRNTLIEDGVLRAYMQDRISAKHYRTDPSGNSRRETFRHYPMPRMTNTYMLAGETPPEEIIRSVDKGIYCVAYSGGQVNISNGDFVFSVTEGYLIENGRLGSPIKGVTLIGNGPDVLSRVTAVGTDYKLSDGRWTCGKDGQSVPVGVGMPTVLVSGITVGGTEQAAGGGELS
ncbi:MAG TPA: metallopeptidase TldD-related protein [Dehalococcoidia bacterium]|nr:metallopeptidase TldD-related protein [Dehalococcoidia bacterium]